MRVPRPVRWPAGALRALALIGAGLGLSGCVVYPEVGVGVGVGRPAYVGPPAYAYRPYYGPPGYYGRPYGYPRGYYGGGWRRW